MSNVLDFLWLLVDRGGAMLLWRLPYHRARLDAGVERLLTRLSRALRVAPATHPILLRLPRGLDPANDNRLFNHYPAALRHFRLSRLLMYLGGCVLFSLGVKLFIDSNLGVDPFHALSMGVVDITPEAVGVGQADGLLTLVLLLLWVGIKRRLPPLSSFVTMLLVGYLVDVWNVADLELLTLRSGPPAFLMLLGLALAAYGSSLIIMSGVGLRVVDLVAIALVHRLRWRFFAAKLLLETGFLLGGLLTGGPIGLATLAFVCVVGPFVEPLIWANRRFLSLPDYGLSGSVEAKPARPLDLGL